MARPTKKAEADAIAQLVQESVRRVDLVAPEAMREAIPALRAARDRLRRDLAKYMERGRLDATFTAHEKAKALRALEGTFEALRAAEPAMMSALKLAESATGPLALKNLNTEILRLGHLFDSSLAMPHVDMSIVMSSSKPLWQRYRTSARRYAGQLGEDLRHQLSIGLAKGETVGALVNRVRKLGGPQTEDAPDGMFKRWRHTADRLVKTEAMNTYNVQHIGAIREANIAIRDEGGEAFVMMWESSADGAVCKWCRNLHGKTAPVGGEFPGGYPAPPIHPYDRCTVIAWRKSWGKRNRLDTRHFTLPE